MSQAQTMPTRPAMSPRPERSGWLHLCNGLDQVRDGGMVPSILGMTGALSRLSSDVTIVTPSPSRLDGALVNRTLSLKGPETDLEAAVSSAEVVHIHGLWQSHTRRGARTARRARVPYMIAAHGMAEPWALRHKKWKKAIYMALVESGNLRRAACLHALSRPEIGHLRELAPWTPICFVPNGVNLDSLSNLPSRSVLERDHPELKDKFVLLFFGRVHVKKGLDLLAEALGCLAPDFPELHVLIAGNDDGAWSPFADRVEVLRLAERVTYVGHVAGDRARAVWGAADAFVLPSYSEGFSMAILEALACSLPCVITTACHFPELADAEGGIIVHPEKNAFTQGLRELLEKSPAERQRLGANGCRLVDLKYTWDQQAHKLASVYQWLSGGGTPPDCVIL